MKARGFFTVIFIGALLTSTARADDHEGQDPTAVCHCKPVINLSLDHNGGLTGCNSTDQLRKEIRELKSELKAVKRKLDETPLGGSSTFDLYFTKRGLSNYVIHHGLDVTVAFTSCFRVRTTDKTGDLTIVSYAVSGNDNEILIKRLTTFDIFIHDDMRKTQVSADDGKWHHICVSWENTAGTWKLYKDGVVAASGVGLKPGYVIKNNGILVIGQDQDSLGGTFDRNQNYIGELTDLNIWNTVLPPGEILGLSKYCHKGSGNVKKWSDFKVGMRGDVRVVSPSECKI